ncbi:hypothetical protein [Massilia sp. TSP1-1-2]|uniref:hypothetical protein n=1 Tax=Massilia sp. TSP1-1-2 TaxID=2804649 RepID=UPI003CF0C742
MLTPPRPKPGPAGTDTGAAGRAWQTSRARLAAALLLAVAGLGALLLAWMPAPSGPPAPAPAPLTTQSPGMASAVTPSLPQTGQAAAQARAAEGDADPTPDLRSYVARGENPTIAQVIERLHERGVYSGLGAFSPPGTSPPLVGLAVPEDFVLPKGYVRHHQATDDGQRIEAILMFAPDFQLLGANGQPVAMPGNRVVPAELAPLGLPIRRIVIPAPTEPARP